MVNLRLIGDAEVPEGPEPCSATGGRAEASHFDWAGDLYEGLPRALGLPVTIVVSTAPATNAVRPTGAAQGAVL